MGFRWLSCLARISRLWHGVCFSHRHGLGISLACLCWSWGLAAAVRAVGSLVGDVAGASGGLEVENSSARSGDGGVAQGPLGGGAGGSEGRCCR